MSLCVLLVVIRVERLFLAFFFWGFVFASLHFLLPFYYFFCLQFLRTMPWSQANAAVGRDKPGPTVALLQRNGRLKLIFDQGCVIRHADLVVGTDVS